MGKLIRCISEDGTLTVMAADTTDIVNRTIGVLLATVRGSEPTQE